MYLSPLPLQQREPRLTGTWLVCHSILQPNMYNLEGTTLSEASKLCTPLYLSKIRISHSISSYLLVLLHSGIQLLGEVIGHIGHARLFLIATTQAALVLTCLLIVLLFGIFAVSLAHLLILKVFYVRYLSYTTSAFITFTSSVTARQNTLHNNLL